MPVTAPPVATSTGVTIMLRFLRTATPLLALAVPFAAATAQVVAYGITTTAQGVQQLVRFNPSSPGVVQVVGATGVQLTGIDFRPATGQLYGYDGDRLYTLDLATGAAGASLDVGNTSGNAGVDFNPTVDRLRVVGASGTNYRINPADGATIVDGAYTFAAGDVNAARTPSFTAVAYTNSDTDPATGTQLYGIDASLGQLVLIGNPNGGTVTTVGSLGIPGFTAVTGFDILTLNGANTAYFTAIAAGSGVGQLYTVNLGTGAATLVGDVGTAQGLQGLALTAVPEPSTWALLGSGLAILAVTARRRRSQRA